MQSYAAAEPRAQALRLRRIVCRAYYSQQWEGRAVLRQNPILCVAAHFCDRAHMRNGGDTLFVPPECLPQALPLELPPSQASEPQTAILYS